MPPNYNSKSTIKHPLKHFPGIHSSNQLPNNLSPPKQPNDFNLKRPKLQLGQSSHKKPQ